MKNVYSKLFIALSLVCAVNNLVQAEHHYHGSYEPNDYYYDGPYDNDYYDGDYDYNYRRGPVGSAVHGAVDTAGTAVEGAVDTAGAAVGGVLGIFR